MTKLIYVAGPYTQPDPIENTRRAINVGEIIESWGYAVFIPHLSLLWSLVSPAPYQRWMDRDRAVLERCDALVRIPGHSLSAEDEVGFARQQGIPVIPWDVDMAERDLASVLRIREHAS